MKKLSYILGRIATLLLIVAPLGCADEYRITTQAQYAEIMPTLRPGDSLVLANGEWRDFEILFSGNGVKDNPIRLRAETKGQVIITGRSNLQLSGEYLEVSGLVFKDGYSPTNTVIAFRDSSGNYANHSRVTEVVIDRFNNPERFETDFWVLMYGQHNRFDHNQLVGKSNQGVTLAVKLDTEQSQQNYHRIDHNYFGYRSVLGSNGGETLRLGTSHYSLTDSYTTVENNFFEHCDGEVEIISNKSGRNTFRGNVFYESRGTLTLRHGNENLVENNVFLGNGVEHTGGIRVINKGQTIRNNYLEGLTGRRFGGALVVMNGVPNSPINRYHQVENADISNNSIINSDIIELAAGADAERSAFPINSQFSRNLIANSSDSTNVNVYGDLSGVEFVGNIVNNASLGELSDRFDDKALALQPAENGLLYPEDNSLVAGVSRDLTVLSRDATGVTWYPKPNNDDPFSGGQTRLVELDNTALYKAVSNSEAGDKLQLSPGHYHLDKTIIIDKPLSILSDGQTTLSFERNAAFEIADGGSLQLKKISIVGDNAPDVPGNTVIRTQRTAMLTNYILVLDEVSVKGLTKNHSFNFFTANKHTFADQIIVRDSRFEDITGHVFALAPEQDDLGIYSAEYISIYTSEFANIGGTIADVYRGGTDESTFGPHFLLADSSFVNVGNSKRNSSGASVHLHGAQKVTISGSEWQSSAPPIVLETTGEPIIVLEDNRFSDTAPSIVMRASDKR